MATDGAVGDAAVHAALDGYRTRMRHYADIPFLDIWYDQITADDLLDVAVPEEREDRAAWVHKQAVKRTNTGAAKKFTEVVDGRRRLVEAPPFRVRDDRTDGIVDEVFAAYRSSLPEERRYLLDRYSFVDVLRQVVGVGSVGMRVFLVLLQGSHPDDLLFLQIKQAGPSVYEAFLGPSRYPNHGQRVTVGRRFIQSSTDIFVGWTRVQGLDLYVRQFRDMKVVPSSEEVAPWLGQFASSAAARCASPRHDRRRHRHRRLPRPQCVVYHRDGPIRPCLRPPKPARPRRTRRRCPQWRDRCRTRLVSPATGSSPQSAERRLAGHQHAHGVTETTSRHPARRCTPRTVGDRRSIRHSRG